MGEQIRVPVACDADIITARQKGREIAAQLGFSATDMVMIATAISELARNILTYAQRGEILLRSADGQGVRGIEVVACDEGPGIRDIEQAIRGGFSTSGGLGLGLAGVRRLMDDFNIVSKVGEGTIVTTRKWNRLHADS